MGDFNTLEDSPAMATFTHEAGFVDAFRSVHPTAAGFTCDQALYGSSPTVSQRIDYLLVLPGAETPGKVCSSQVILHTPQQLADGRIVWPSDHYGVLAEVEVFGRVEPGRKDDAEATASGANTGSPVKVH
jgi:exonuclease III